MRRLFHWLFGPRDFAVIAFDGTPIAVHAGQVYVGDVVLRTGLRASAAHSLARRLRQQREDYPEAIL